MATPLLDYVLSELTARKGSYIQIAKEMEPDNWQAYYSWLTKFVRGVFPDPGIRRIEALAARFQRESEEARKTAA